MITLITGGASSGKSTFAEKIAVKFINTKLYYVATMHALDEEGKQRVTRHRAMRKGKGFTTIECYTNIANITIDKNSTVLLECMPNLLANEMFDKDGAKQNCVEKILSDIEKLSENAKNLIIITNEVFSDGCIYDNVSQQYIQNLGIINKKIAALSDTVIENVVGIPVYLKRIL